MTDEKYAAQPLNYMRKGADNRLFIIPEIWSFWDTDLVLNDELPSQDIMHLSFTVEVWLLSADPDFEFTWL
jgi:hypothetical protein